LYMSTAAVVVWALTFSSQSRKFGSSKVQG
jgi:hypothetical protein